MSNKKGKQDKIKSQLHPRNKHRSRYKLNKLKATCPELSPFLVINEYNDLSIDFFNPEAVKTLNKALLIHYYGIKYWDIPVNYLCPPIPGRADYIHYVADLLATRNKGKIPKGKKVKCLDIGVGANCVYPIIGNYEYGWSFIGSEIDQTAVNSANHILALNPHLEPFIDIRHQQNKGAIFKDIIKKDEHFDITICNPPFHGSAAEAQAATRKKVNNLKRRNIKNPTLNFGGKNNELWCDGGEEKFVRNMISESKAFATSCNWFTSLISKKTTLDKAYKSLAYVQAKEIKTIEMNQGNKVSRILAWRF